MIDHMSEGFDILAKMDPMARRALASIEAMQKAIELNDRDGIAKNLEEAKNALSMVEDDLGLHDRVTKALSDQSVDIQVGSIRKFDNDYNGAEQATALGVVRPGRSDRLFRPHDVF